jgi:branched-chain amino acid transport system substrate-binding protein
MRVRKGLLAAVVLACFAAGVAGAAPRSDPGVTSSSILIGGTSPISGEAAAGAAVATGANAYFKWINGHGKVNGRTITYKILDDGYDPGKTVVAVRQLVEQDNVFAIFNVLGTNNNLAVRDYLNGKKVPQLFAASGFTGFGSDYRKYPDTIGYIPTYSAEGAVYGRYLAATKPTAKIAVLYQDDDYGKDLVNGLKRGLGSKAGNIVKSVGYDPTQPDVNSQVSDLKSSGANVFMIFCFGKFALQAFIQANKLGWRPQIFVNDVAATTGIMQVATATATKKETTGAISIVFAKDPADPAWAKDPGILLFQRVMRAAGLGSSVNLTNGYYLAGMASAFTLVDALKQAGKNLTRQTLLKATANLKEANNPFLLPGVVVKTGPNDRFPIQQMQLQRWNGSRWIRFGGLVTAQT